uniref:hydroxymethylbilane synthase n=1 Tax=Henneguya salminicola TaxID=69463 RepID=A0A6G3MEE9_HENSL
MKTDQLFIKAGTRGSNLAIIQKDIICDLIRNNYSNVDFETVIVSTTGDQIKDIPISEIGQLGVFSGELCRALTNNELDIIVHSLKDLPTKLNSGTVICMIPK